MEAIDSIKIIQVEGLSGSQPGESGGIVNGNEGNLASSAVAAALRYRAQAPIVDGLMKELGFNGSSLENLTNAVVPSDADKRSKEEGTAAFSIGSGETA